MQTLQTASASSILVLFKCSNIMHETHKEMFSVAAQLQAQAVIQNIFAF